MRWPIYVGDAALVRHIDMLRDEISSLRTELSLAERDAKALRMMLDRVELGLPRELPVGWGRMTVEDQQQHYQRFGR